MKFLRRLLALQVKTNFVSYVVVAVALWVIPDTSGVLRFLLAMILIARIFWNFAWFGNRAFYFLRHPEKDTLEEVPRTFSAATVRAIEAMVLIDSLFSVMEDIVEGLPAT